MASANHVNYWNYLENVTANRNREKLTSEGLGLQKEEIGLKSRDLDLKEILNNSQIRVNSASESKFLTEAISVLSNIGFSERMTKVKEKELDFNVNKWADQFGLNKLELKKDLLGLQIDLHKISVDKTLKEGDQAIKMVEIYSKVFSSILGGMAKGG